MALKPTIVSPGVELLELDESIRASVPSGTTVFIPGFAPQGPTDEVISVSSLEDFETTFGTPTNAAERYFWQTVKNVLASPANILVSRLPYGPGKGDTTSPQYTLLAYPAVGFTLKKSGETYSYEAMTKFTDGSAVTDITGSNTKDSATIIIGEPVQFSISLGDYYKLLTGELVSWSENILGVSESVSVPTTITDLGKFAFFTLDVRKTVTNEKFEGYYIGLSDNAFSNPLDGYNAITKLKTVTTSDSGLTGTGYTEVPEERCNFKLNGTVAGSVSQIMQESINNFDISNAQWNDTLNFGIFKIREATGADALKLTAILTDGFNASLEAGRKTSSKTSSGLVDFYVETLTSDNSLFNVFVNPYFADVTSNRGLNTDGTPKIKVRTFTKRLVDSALDISSSVTAKEVFESSYGITKTALNSIKSIKPVDALYPLGLYSKTNGNTKLIGNVPGKLSNVLSLISNDEVYDVDILVEGGLSTIYATAIETAVKEGDTDAPADSEHCIFDDTAVFDSITDLRTSKALGTDATRVVDNVDAVHNQFLTLACSQQDGGRGDLCYVADGLRQVMIEGKNTKVESKYGIPYEITGDDGEHIHSFSASIYWPLRHIFKGIVSSYMITYPHFLKYTDTNTGYTFWCPASGAIAGKMASTDALYGPWQAAAGRNNGVLAGVLDTSFSTNQRQRDDLYKISLNCINSTPANGTLVWGIRTMIKKDSVFDQITCRRTFLYLEKVLRNTSVNFLFEGNTEYTRLRVVNTIEPVLQSMVNARALYDYVLICDSRNNTSDVIDEGNMRIDLYASPVRTAERILIAVHATKSGAITTEFDV